MNGENKSTIIDLSKYLILDLTKELNDELAKLNSLTTTVDANDILTNCDGTLAKLNSRVQQLKKVL